MHNLKWTDDAHFYGELDSYAQGKAVLEFLDKHGVSQVYLSHGKLVDRVSILGFTP